MLQLGILLAIFCAFATNVGFLLKHRGACAAPDVSLKHPVASAVGLFRSKWFALGMLVALGAWVFHVAALALAPLSVVQAVIAGGLVFLTVLAERYFGCSVGTRQWAGVGLTALGLVLLAVTLPHHAGESSYSTVGMIAFESALLALGTFLVLSKKLGSHEHHGVMLGTAAGILFGVSDVAIKALTTSVGTGGGFGLPSSVARDLRRRLGHRLLRVGPRAPEGRGRAGHHAHERGGQRHGHQRRHPRLRRPDAERSLGIVVQSFAFVLVIVAAALMPAPLRVGRATA